MNYNRKGILYIHIYSQEILWPDLDIEMVVQPILVNPPHGLKSRLPPLLTSILEESKQDETIQARPMCQKCKNMNNNLLKCKICKDLFCNSCYLLHAQEDVIYQLCHIIYSAELLMRRMCTILKKNQMKIKLFGQKSTFIIIIIYIMLA